MIAPVEAVSVARINRPPSTIPKPVLAAVAELCQGEMGEGSRVVMASTLCKAGQPIDCLGGTPGYWFAALQTPSIDSDLLPQSVVNWATRMIASTSITAAIGTLQPSELKTWDLQAVEVDKQFALALSLLMTDYTGQILRNIGLAVLRQVKDQDLKAKLKLLPLEDVASYRVDDGRTIIQVLGIDTNKYIEQATARFTAALLILLEHHQEQAVQIWEAVYGVDPTTEAAPDYNAVVLFLLLWLRNRSEEGFDGKAWTTTGVGLGTQVVDIIAGNEVGSTTAGDDGKPKTWSDRPGWEVATITVITRKLVNGETLTDIAKLLAEGRVVIRRDRYWKHVTTGDPFIPHKNLDGLLAGSEAYVEKLLEPLTRARADGTEIFTAPFNARWQLGDHKGCRCYFRYDTYIVFSD